MTIQGREFHQTAQEIVAGTPCSGEAAARTACGRAYYAVFLAYRKAVRRKQSDDEYDFEHNEFRKALRQKARVHDLIAKLSTYVNGLLEWRTDSDYHPATITVSASTASQRTEDAGKAIALIDEILRRQIDLPIPIKKPKYNP